MQLWNAELFCRLLANYIKLAGIYCKFLNLIEVFTIRISNCYLASCHISYLSKLKIHSQNIILTANLFDNNLNKHSKKLIWIYYNQESFFEHYFRIDRSDHWCFSFMMKFLLMKWCLWWSICSSASLEFYNLNSSLLYYYIERFWN